MTTQQIAHRDRILSKFVARFSEKYANGQVEHGGNIWEKPGMLRHAIEEVVDLVAYLFTLEEQLSQPRADMPVVYVAGPFRAESAYGVELNIRRAEALALEVWRLNCAAVCPHTNTRHFSGVLPDETWLTGDLAILSRCDVLLLTPDWAESSGATAERAFATQRGMPVCETLDELATWLRARAA